MDRSRLSSSLVKGHNIVIDIVEIYVEWKVAERKGELECISEIAMTQTQPAYAAFTYGLSSKWIYLARTVPNIEPMLKPMEKIIRYKFLPAITGQNALNDSVQDLMALPTYLGGLDIADPSRISSTITTTLSISRLPLLTLL